LVLHLLDLLATSGECFLSFSSIHFIFEIERKIFFEKLILKIMDPGVSSPLPGSNDFKLMELHVVLLCRGVQVIFHLFLVKLLQV
jgi:hypothetical protein